jgi:hypothetical protein
MTDRKVSAEDKSGDRTYFTLIPNMLYEIGLTPYDRDLYHFYKKVAGEAGECWMEFRSISKQTGMSPAQVSNSRKALIAKGLIECTKRKHGESGWATWHIIVKDVWAENITICKEAAQKRIEESQKCSLSKQSVQAAICLPGEQIGLPGEQSCLQDGVLIRSKETKNTISCAQNAQGAQSALSVSESVPVLPKVALAPKKSLRFAVRMPCLSEQVTDEYLALFGQTTKSLGIGKSRKVQGQIRNLLGLTSKGKPNGYKAYPREQIIGCAQALKDGGVSVSPGLISEVMDIYLADEDAFPPDWLKPVHQRQPRIERDAQEHRKLSQADIWQLEAAGRT